MNKKIKLIILSKNMKIIKKKNIKMKMKKFNKKLI